MVVCCFLACSYKGQALPVALKDMMAEARIDHVVNLGIEIMYYGAKIEGAWVPYTVEQPTSRGMPSWTFT